MITGYGFLSLFYMTCIYWFLLSALSLELIWLSALSLEL
jgi:hypothetical protein